MSNGNRIKPIWEPYVASIESGVQDYNRALERAREEESTTFAERVAKKVARPKHIRNKVIAEAYVAGVPISVIALTAGVSRNTVYKIAEQGIEE